MTYDIQPFWVLVTDRDPFHSDKSEDQDFAHATCFLKASSTLFSTSNHAGNPATITDTKFSPDTSDEFFTFHVLFKAHAGQDPPDASFY